MYLEEVWTNQYSSIAFFNPVIYPAKSHTKSKNEIEKWLRPRIIKRNIIWKKDSKRKFLENNHSFPRIGEHVVPATTSCSLDSKMVQSKSMSSRVLRSSRGTGFISEIGKFVPPFISLFLTSLNDVIYRNFKRFQIPLMLFDSPNTYRSLEE